MAEPEVKKKFQKHERKSDNNQRMPKACSYRTKKELVKYEAQLPTFAPRGREDELPELKKASSYAFRFEPSPTGPLHIGHTIILLLNAEYAKKYKGKLVVRIADTNPEDIYEPAYNMIIKDAEWITQQKSHQ